MRTPVQIQPELGFLNVITSFRWTEPNGDTGDTSYGQMIAKKIERIVENNGIRINTLSKTH